jgi:transcriptional regulator with XRE-family HTH domain
MRERLGLTQAQGAALVGVHSVTWCRWELDQLTPSTYQSALLRRFATAAQSPKCPEYLGVLSTSLGPINVLALLLQLSGGVEGGEVKRRRRARRSA